MRQVRYNKKVRIRMATEQIMSKAIAKAVRVAIQAMAEATAEWLQDTAGTKIGNPAMKQSMFNWDSEDRYSELKTFKLEINNILSTYNNLQAEQLTMVKIWLGRKGLQFLETLTNVEKMTCCTLGGLYNILTSKFRPQFNETFKSMQFRIFCRNDGENVEEWTERLRVTPIVCNYQEVDRQLKEQFIHGLNYKNMLEEIIKELMTVKSDQQTTSGNVYHGQRGWKHKGLKQP